MKIAVTGTTGLIGSRFKSLLANKYDIFEVNTSSGIDIRKRNQLLEGLDEASPDLIINFAAKTNVDACEEDREKDTEKLKNLGILNNGKINIDKVKSDYFEDDDTAFAINTMSVKNLADYAKDKGIKFIYISTDFVFQGDREYYNEDDEPNPIDWYGMTKFFGEEIVRNRLSNFMIVRTAFPYGFYNEKKSDFIWKLFDLIKKNNELSLVEDQIITPTFIDDIVFGLGFLIDKNYNGVIHLAGDDFHSPYEIGKLISKVFLNKEQEFKKIKRDDLYKSRAKRPFKVRIKNDKLEKLGFETKTLKEGLKIIKNKL